MLINGLFFVGWTALAAASWDGNINYRSPSFGHAPLGINTNKVNRRMLQKRDGTYYHSSNVTFTHGVASVKQFIRSLSTEYY